MDNFPGNYSVGDAFAFRAAVEAVVGVTLQGSQANEETIQAWLKTAVDAEIPSREVRGRAMYFAQRMFGGPFRPDGP